MLQAKMPVWNLPNRHFLKYSVAKRNEQRNKCRTDHAVKDRKHNGFLVGETNHHGKGCVLAGGSGGRDTGVIIEAARQNGDEEEGKNFPHQIA